MPIQIVESDLWYLSENEQIIPFQPFKEWCAFMLADGTGPYFGLVSDARIGFVGFVRTEILDRDERPNRVIYFAPGQIAHMEQIDEAEARRRFEKFWGD